MFGKAVRVLLCLLALLLLEAGLSSEVPATRSLIHTTDCPAGALRHLTSANRFDKSRFKGRSYGQLQGLFRYEQLVRLQAEKIGMDWRLLSAIIWHESQFNEAALSPMEAKGLMQVRDVTALHFGISPDEVDLFDPQVNIAIGARLIDELIEQFHKEGMDSTNAVRFALASYNCGGGTLAKRRAEAAEAGLDPADWSSVATIFERYSRLTPAYVDSVEQTYFSYCDIAD
jgi:membrane-bound lytic murein transglycosylase F